MHKKKVNNAEVMTCLMCAGVSDFKEYTSVCLYLLNKQLQSEKNYENSGSSRETSQGWKREGRTQYNMVGEQMWGWRC